MPVGCLLDLMMQMYEGAFRRACLCDECIKWREEHPELEETDNEEDE